MLKGVGIVNDYPLYQCFSKSVFQCDSKLVMLFTRPTSYSFLIP